MSAETTQPQAQKADTTNTPSPAEEWVERVGSYWGRAVASAWRTVFPPDLDWRHAAVLVWRAFFPPREDYK